MKMFEVIFPDNGVWIQFANSIEQAWAMWPEAVEINEIEVI